MLTNIALAVIITASAWLLMLRLRPPQGDNEPLPDDVLRDIIRREGHRGDIGEGPL